MDLPSADDYKSAILAIASDITASQCRMLRAHSQAPEGTLTADELAVAAGFQSWKPVNIHYGRLGSALRTALGAKGELPGQRSYAIASFQPPDHSRPRWRWIMHLPLRDALAELGWFDDELLGDDSAEIYRASMKEGMLYQRLTTHRKRENALRVAKLETARRTHPLGRLVCQVPRCGFDFELVYGIVGAGYAEVHHLLPLSASADERETTLDDLLVVCSNCHRMIHRGGECRAVETLLPPDR